MKTKASKSADAAITAPEYAPGDGGDVEEMHPQAVADGPSQLIRDICNSVSYPRATKTASWANSGVAQKHTTQAHARREITQGNGGAQKKATQGVVGRVISPVQERVQERLLVRSAVILHPALLPLQIAVW
jgi:hypothetical protein